MKNIKWMGMGLLIITATPALAGGLLGGAVHGAGGVTGGLAGGLAGGSGPLGGSIGLGGTGAGSGALGATLGSSGLTGGMGGGLGSTTNAVLGNRDGIGGGRAWGTFEDITPKATALTSRARAPGQALGNPVGSLQSLKGGDAHRAGQTGQHEASNRRSTVEDRVQQLFTGTLSRGVHAPLPNVPSPALKGQTSGSASGSASASRRDASLNANASASSRTRMARD